MKSAMHPAFNTAMTDQLSNAHKHESYCDWLTFIGSPNLYDAGHLSIALGKNMMRLASACKRQCQRGGNDHR